MCKQQKGKAARKIRKFEKAMQTKTKIQLYKFGVFVKQIAY